MSRHFGPTRQLGLVVRDFDATLKAWTEVHGAGPFFIFRDTPVQDYLYRGQVSEAPVLSIAFGYSGDLQIEIIHQQNDAPSIYTEFLASGREGLHHVSSFLDVQAYDAVYAGALERGLTSVHQGSIGGVRFAYFDSEDTPGATVQEISESGIAEVAALYQTLQDASSAWDGTDPVRPLQIA